MFLLLCMHVIVCVSVCVCISPQFADGSFPSFSAFISSLFLFYVSTDRLIIPGGTVGNVFLDPY